MCTCVGRHVTWDGCVKKCIATADRICITFLNDLTQGM